MKSAEDKAKEVSEKILNQEVTLTFSRRECIVLHNILVAQHYKLGDLTIVEPLYRKLQAEAAVDSNIEPKGN